MVLGKVVRVGGILLIITKTIVCIIYIEHDLLPKKDESLLLRIRADNIPILLINKSIRIVNNNIGKIGFAGYGKILHLIKLKKQRYANILNSSIEKIIFKYPGDLS